MNRLAIKEMQRRAGRCTNNMLENIVNSLGSMKKSLEKSLASLLFAAGLSLSSTPTLAENPPVLTWEKNFSLEEEKYMGNVIQLEGGSTLLEGTTWDAIGGYRLLFIKTDLYGNIQWQKSLSVDDFVPPSVIRPTNDGGAFLFGSIGVGTPDSDACLLKIDSNGNKKFRKTFEGPFGGCNYGDDARQTKDNGYILVGDTLTHHTYDGRDFWHQDIHLIKTDANGNKKWDKTFGDIYGDYGLCVIQTSDGGYLVGGSRTKKVSSEWKSFAYLMKLDSNGDKKWEKYLDQDEYVSSLEQIRDNDYIMLTSSDLIKTDSNGNIQWKTNLNFTGRMKKTPDNGFIITYFGQSLFKYSDRGNLQWEMGISSNGLSVSSIEPTRDGDYLFLGQKFHYPDPVVTWLAKYSQRTAVPREAWAQYE